VSARIPGIDRRFRTAILFAALLSLVTARPAVAGYDIAHIVKRTCVPGGPLIVTDEWKQPKDRDRVVTEPGEVIGCPPAGSKDSFQIAAGSERTGRDRFLCTYLSLFNGDGSDSCWETRSFGDSQPQIQPLRLIRPDRSPILWLVGIASEEVARVSTRPGPRPREQDLRASGGLNYFAVTVDREDLCADPPLRILGFDDVGRMVADSTVSTKIGLLSATDRVSYANSMNRQCKAVKSEEPATSLTFVDLGALILSLLRFPL